MIPLKEQNKTPVTDPKEMQIYELLDKEVKIIDLKKVTASIEHR